MTVQLNIGVIGAGDIFRRRHFPNLAALDSVSIVAIANRSKESAREISEAFDLGADPTDDPQTILTRDDIDAVMIGTWPYRHKRYTTAALAAGKHVFVQARMAASLAEAKGMYAAARETDLIAQICPSPFGMAVDTVVQRRIQDGFIGDIRMVRGHRINGNRIDPSDPIHWRDIERYQGINALSVGILMERVHRWVGATTHVSATAETFIPERPSQDGETSESVDLPDTVTVRTRFNNGAVGTFDFSSIAAHGPNDRIELYGSDGTLIYDAGADMLYGAKPEASELEPIPIPEEDRDEWTVERDFVEAIRIGGSPRTSFVDGVKYMEVSEAVCRSVQSGSSIELPIRT